MEPTAQNDRGNNALEEIQKNPEFQERHKEDLGVKAFGKEMAIGFIPLIVGGIAAVIGYKAIAPQLRSLKTIKKLELLNAIKDKIWQSKPSEMADQVITLFKDLAPKFESIPKEEKNIGSLLRVVKNHATLEMLEGTAKSLKIEKVKPLGWIKGVTAAVTGYIGLLATAIPLGYRQWKKDESARIGALELGENISKLELFKPTDQGR